VHESCGKWISKNLDPITPTVALDDGLLLYYSARCQVVTLRFSAAAIALWPRVSAGRRATLRLRSGQASREARGVAHPQLFRSMLKDKPALYFPVEVAHPSWK